MADPTEGAGTPTDADVAALVAWLAAFEGSREREDVYPDGRAFVLTGPNTSEAVDSPNYPAATVRALLDRAVRAERERDEAYGQWEAHAAEMHRAAREAQEDAARLRSAILWALGYDMPGVPFLPREAGQGAYWWRSTLQRLAGDALRAPAATEPGEGVPS